MSSLSDELYTRATVQKHVGSFVSRRCFQLEIKELLCDRGNLVSR